MIKEILLNKWFFSFVISWIAFLFLVDKKTFKKNVWGGITASMLELWQDATAITLGMYNMQDTGISILKVPIFFTFGVVFTMGVLFMQYIPRNPKLQLLHIVVFAIGFVTFEFILESYGLLIQPHWNLVGSFFDNTIIMGSFVWLKQYIQYKSKTE